MIENETVQITITLPIAGVGVILIKSIISIEYSKLLWKKLQSKIEEICKGELK